MAYEDTLVNQIIGAISGFKKGTKTPKEVNKLIGKLRETNPELAKDYNKKFVDAANEKNAAKK